MDIRDIRYSHEYILWKNWQNSLNIPEAPLEHYCLSFLSVQNEGDKVGEYKYLYLCIENRWDKYYTEEVGHSAQEWIDLLDKLELTSHEKIEIDEEFIHVWYSLEDFHQTTLTSHYSFIRYLGEITEHVLCYWDLKALYPKMEDIHAIIAAHKCSLLLWQGGSNHSVFKSGTGTVDLFSLDKVKERLKATPKHGLEVHDCWDDKGRNNNLQPIEKLFSNCYFLEKEAA